MKNITVLGVTGSIGMQTVDVVKNHLDKFKIVAMSAGYNIKRVEEILEMIDVEYVCVVQKKDAQYLQEKYPDLKEEIVDAITDEYIEKIFAAKTV